jgi:hypothetical protein
MNKLAEERENVIKYLNALRNPEARAKIKPLIEKQFFNQLKEQTAQANQAISKSN